MDMVHGSVFLAICSNWIGVALLATDTNVVPCRGGGGGWWAATCSKLSGYTANNGIIQLWGLLLKVSAGLVSNSSACW